MSSRKPRRVFRPHRDWLALDFVIAAIGLAFLGVALTGLATLVNAAANGAALAGDCRNRGCEHAGTLTAKARTHFPSQGYGGLYDVGPSPDYCVLTMSLDVGSRQAAVTGPTCDALSAPSPITAEIWRGQVVAVEVDGRTFPTYFDPSAGVFSGLLRLVALVPFAFCVALIEVDIANHRHVWRVRHRFFGRRSNTHRGATRT